MWNAAWERQWGLIMDSNELRRRTKLAVSRWSGVPATEILMDDKLGDLKPGSREPLRQRLNEEFDGEPGMPITPHEWAEKAAKTVADCRDLVKEKVES